MLPAFLQLRGLVKQHIDSYNYFLTVELQQILLANQKVHCDADPSFFLKYTDIRVGAPSVEEELVVSKTTPNECRLRDMTYAAPILVDVEYVRGRRLVKRQNVVIGRMPIMLRSCRCVLTDRTRGELAALQEWSAIQAHRRSQLFYPPLAAVLPSITAANRVYAIHRIVLTACLLACSLACLLPVPPQPVRSWRLLHREGHGEGDLDSGAAVQEPHHRGA